MKYLFIIIAISCGSIFTQDLPTELKTLTNKPNFNKGTIYYTPYPYGQYYSSTLYFYMNGNENAVHGGRLVFQYVGSKWIYFDKVIVSYDNEQYTFMGIGITKDLKNSYVSEELDLDVTTKPELLNALRGIIKAKSVKLKFSGKDEYETTLNPSQIATLIKYFSIYDKYAASKLLRDHQNAINNNSRTPQEQGELVGAFIVVLLLLVGVISAFMSNRSRMRLQDEYYKRMINKMKQEEKSDF